MSVNYWGVVHACRAYLPVLRASAVSGHATAIAVVLSDFAFFSLPTKAAYAASKHAAHAFTVALAGELAGSGVRVTAVYPGATATGIVAHGEAVDPVRQVREAEFLAGGMAPAKVAAALLRGVERGKARVLVGTDARLLAVANGIAPTLTQWAVRRWWRQVPFL
jgi:short-subunit dehydrogenase